MMATDKQIGGKHYTELAIQPDEYSHKNELSFMQGNAIKYITRYKFKNGKEDLLKAISVIQKLIEFEYADYVKCKADSDNVFERFLENLKGLGKTYNNVLLKEEAIMSNQSYEDFKKRLDSISENNLAYLGSPGGK